MMRCVLLLACLLPMPALAQGVPEPEGYREAPYRGPVPETLTGATVVDIEAAHTLWQAGEVVFIDVLPHAARPENLPEGTIWRNPPHETILGATWLPNVGYPVLPPEDETYFRDGIEALTGGDPDRGVLFFCLEECWMSWNAAKRAVEYGHSNVYWYPGGADGWARAGHPIARVTPAKPS